MIIQYGEQLLYSSIHSLNFSSIYSIFRESLNRSTQKCSPVQFWQRTWEQFASAIIFESTIATVHLHDLSLVRVGPLRYHHQSEPCRDVILLGATGVIDKFRFHNICPLTRSLSTCWSRSFSRVNFSTSSMFSVFLFGAISSRAMCASFSLMAARIASCLQKK